MLSDRDEFGASIDNSKEKLIDDDGMTKNNTESLLASLACSAPQCSLPIKTRRIV